LERTVGLEEDSERIIIPTMSKAKISHDLSWPIGAETVSAALATTAADIEFQASLLVLV